MSRDRLTTTMTATATHNALAVVPFLLAAGKRKHGQQWNLDRLSNVASASGEAKYPTAFLCWNFAWKCLFFFTL